jgi:oxygen-independent coproporphyrinogen-3 oxidase
MQTKRGGGMYVHIPFCESVCDYCHFVRTANHDPELRRRVVDDICREFTLRQVNCRVLREGRRSLRTVYFGGGTPSVLEPELMASLWTGTVGCLPVSRRLEATAEANPESLTAELAAQWRGIGINRISLGIQGLNDEVLTALGRRCDANTARRALRLANQHFERVAADWILGPGVQASRLVAELAEAVSEGVGHISLYILEVHRDTSLANSLAAGHLTLPADDQLETIYLSAVDALARCGLHQYEVANFALPGHESRHNRSYWRRAPYLGLGPGAHGFWGRRRYTNHPEPAIYHKAVREGHLPEAWAEILDPASRHLEKLFLALRTAQGIPLAALPPQALPLAKGRDEGLWEIHADFLSLTARGFLHIDGIEEKLARGLGRRMSRRRHGPG